MSDELLKIRFMTKDDADDHMVQNKLTFQAICEAMEIQYCTFKDHKEWLPARNVWDSKLLSTQYGVNIVEEKALTHTEFMALMQSGFAAGPSRSWLWSDLLQRITE